MTLKDGDRHQYNRSALELRAAVAVHSADSALCTATACSQHIFCSGLHCSRRLLRSNSWNGHEIQPRDTIWVNLSMHSELQTRTHASPH